MLIGHDAARDVFREALASGRMHHAWLITGPKGIGKRRFADWAALTLLSGGMAERETATQDLLDAGSHPDHRILEPPLEGAGSATASIVVEQIRQVTDFLHSYPAIAPWRTMIVDAIDDMNLSAANAFLKELEEPRQQTVYLLISHSPLRLLPTIRSRCRQLRLTPLGDAETRIILQDAEPELSPEHLAALVQMAGGAPGVALALAGADVAALEKDVQRLLKDGNTAAFAGGFQAKSALPKLQALLQLVPRRIAMAARRNADPRLLDLYDEAARLAAEAVPLAYDRMQVAMALATMIIRLERIQENS